MVSLRTEALTDSPSLSCSAVWKTFIPGETNPSLVHLWPMLRVLKSMFHLDQLFCTLNCMAYIHLLLSSDISVTYLTPGTVSRKWCSTWWLCTRLNDQYPALFSTQSPAVILHYSHDLLCKGFKAEHYLYSSNWLSCLWKEGRQFFSQWPH